MTISANEIAVTTQEIASLYSVSTGTVRRWVELGNCPHLQPSPGVLRFLPSEVAQWMRGKVKEAEAS